MFIGHFALGFAAKRATPRVSLAMLFAAAQFADLLWPFLLLVGLEQVRIEPGNDPFLHLNFVTFPYSHSLLLLVVWGALLGYIYMTVTRAGMQVFVTIAALVVSHWLFDYVTHLPDMPLYPGGPKLGLGLWNSPAATIAIEGAMFVAGCLIYGRATQARDGVGRWGFAALVALLAVAYVASLMSGPPSSVNGIAVGAIVGAAAILWLTWWEDRHRAVA